MGSPSLDQLRLLYLIERYTGAQLAAIEHELAVEKGGPARASGASPARLPRRRHPQAVGVGSRGTESSRWIKELHLSVLVYRTIELGLFDDYDWAPSLVEFRGVRLYGKVSQEAHADLRKLQSARLIDKLHLSTCLYDTIRAYRAATGAAEALEQLDESLRLSLDRALVCGRCGALREVTASAEGNGSENATELVCRRCAPASKRPGVSGGEAIDFFEIADIVYRTRPLAPGGLS